MIVIPVQSDEKTIAKGFRKAEKFVFLDPESGIVIQENHYKRDKSPVFFAHFEKYNVDTLYVKDLGYKTYLQLEALGIKVWVIQDTTLYTHINPDELIELHVGNAKDFCSLGHDKKGSEN